MARAGHTDPIPNTLNGNGGGMQARRYRRQRPLVAVELQAPLDKG